MQQLFQLSQMYKPFLWYFFVLFPLTFRVAINFLNTLSKDLHLGLTIKRYPNIMYCMNIAIWHKNEGDIFCTTTPTSVPQHHLPAMKSFMTCPLMEFCHYSDVTQNLPQSLFPVTMLQTEYILPLLLIVHCISSWSWGGPDSIFASISCKKKGKEIRSEEY